MKLNEIKIDIDAVCRLNGIEDYTINNDGSIDVEGNVDLKRRTFLKFPLKFNKVTGNFTCYENDNLISLQGAPIEVGGSFYCYTCKNLTSLKYAPITVKNNFSCSTCPMLTSLEYAPAEVGGDFYCYQCFGLTKLSHLKIINKGLFMRSSPITNLLYAFKIKGLQSIETEIVKLDKIINKHLHGDRDVMACQEELIEAGFEKYARLK